ncbi:6-phosphofructokinase [bacterium]|nr:6-phosphofructokinase [bacterium]
MPKKIAVLTSGGDAPGMNAAVRAVVRCGISAGLEVELIYRGYEGLLAGEFEKVDSKAVSNMLSRGGSFIGCARSAEMLQPHGPGKAAGILKDHGIDCLLAIGGDGTFRGAKALMKNGANVIGLTGTIDNDIPGMDRTLGFDTACDTLAWCINRLRDTAESHHRTFVIEAMGRNAGWLALHAGMACGADVILIPEIPWDREEVLDTVTRRISDGRTFSLVVIAEGAGRATDLTGFLNQHLPEMHEVRACIPGHIQRGGAPTTVDRILASRTGFAAVQAYLAGRTGMVVGQLRGEVVEVAFDVATSGIRGIDRSLYDLAMVLA